MSEPQSSRIEIQRVSSTYLDLDEIIASSESTPCTFSEIHPDFFKEMLGIAKPSQTPDGLCADTPLWLIESTRNFTVHLPRSFGTSMQGVLNADAKNVNLSRLEQHFYSNGMQLCHLMKGGNGDGALNLAKCLLSTLTQRLGDIVSSAAHQRNKADKFDSLETRVFLEGKRCKEDIDAWLRQDGGSSKKRKRNSC